MMLFQIQIQYKRNSMSFFDDDSPKQRKPKKPYVPKEERIKSNKQLQAPNVEVKERRRRARQKEKLKKMEQQKKERVYPPLMIRAKVNQEQSEQPLEEFVTELYQSRSQKKETKHIEDFLEEDDEGNTEYKLKLICPSEDRLEHLTTQMKYRIIQGLGDAHYRIGVEDNGKPTGLDQEQMLESLRTICLLASRVRADVMVLRVSDGFKGLVIQLVIRKRQRIGVKLQVRVLLSGESGSGKSTLLGVLKSGQKDDGKGLARVKIFTHKHELLTGTTQSRSYHVIGFDMQGKVFNQSMMMIDKWLDNASKVLTFIDVGGHKKAQKQVVSSLCSFFPEYALWVVSGVSKAPINPDTLELANIFHLPLIVVITHLDKMDKAMELQAILRIKQQLKRFFPDKTPCVVRQMEHAVLFSRITSSQDVLPIFLISNVTGKNMDLLTSFFNLLTAASQLKNNEQMSTEFSISNKFGVDGNIIIAGTVIKGTVKKGQLLHIGPDFKGAFRAIQVMSIECLRVPVKLAKCGQVCTIAIRPLNYAKQWLQKQPNAIRRGMVLVDHKSNPKAVYQFLVEVTPYSNQRQEFTLTDKCQPVLNTLTTRQICNIIVMKPSKEIQAPELLFKKKSKSIDSRKIQHNYHTSYLTQSIDIKPRCIKIPSKKSVDWSAEVTEESPKRLEPIAEQPTLKKVKQTTQIKFCSGQPTLLRLRFKYYPQYMTLGQKVIIYELKLVGRVKQIFY